MDVSSKHDFFEIIETIHSISQDTQEYPPLKYDPVLYQTTHQLMLQCFFLYFLV